MSGYELLAIGTAAVNRPIVAYHSSVRPNVAEAAERQRNSPAQRVSVLMQEGATGPMLNAGDENDLQRRNHGEGSRNAEEPD